MLAVGLVDAGVAPEPGAILGQLRRALGRPAVLAGFWLFTLPAIFAGVIEVLGPLRLDDLGASGAAIGAVFLLTAAVEAVLSPVAGRASDRRGRLVPIRAGLLAAAVVAVLLPLPGTVVLLALAIMLAFASPVASGPAMAMLSDASEDAGLDQALAFSIANLAWAVGHVVGAGGGGGLAERPLKRPLRGPGGDLRVDPRRVRSSPRARRHAPPPAERAGLPRPRRPSRPTPPRRRSRSAHRPPGRRVRGGRERQLVR